MDWLTRVKRKKEIKKTLRRILVMAIACEALSKEVELKYSDTGIMVVKARADWEGFWKRHDLELRLLRADPNRVVNLFSTRGSWVNSDGMEALGIRYGSEEFLEFIADIEERMKTTLDELRIKTKKALGDKLC